MSLNGDSRASPIDPAPDRPPSVQRRILVRLVPLLALLFAAVLYWLGENLKSSLYSANLEIARQSNVMAVYAVERSMITDDVHRPWDLMAQEFPRDEGSEIEVINTDGVVVFSTDPTKRGTSYELGDPSCSECHEGGSTRATAETAFISAPENAEHLVFAAPLRNTGNCQNCHPTQERKLGMVRVQRALGPIHEQIRAMQTGIAVAGGITLLITMLTTRMLLGRYLGRPLRELMAGARAIGSGNLQHKVEVPDRGELAVLADTLNASTARLARLQEELIQSERLAAVGETVAGLAHSLKNTLNALRAGQYVVDRAMELNDAEKLRKGRQVMKSAVGQVERLTFDMLYYIKERQPELEAVDPNQIAREVIDGTEDSAELRGVDLRAELDPEIGTLALDRTAIFRALVDLVTNAIDACAESESGDLVVLRTRRAGPQEIVLTVEDNGIGISEEVRSKLFTRLFSTKAGKGTGLGLSVVKKIAEGHGGDVEVESEPGKGSAFHIHLPRASS
jgi:signal transduction histidine kinase